MRKLLNIYYTSEFASIDVTNGAKRSYSSQSMVQTIDAMTPENRDVLVGFCKAVISYTQGESSELMVKR